MEYEISPEPGDEERRAILAALAREAEEAAGESPWARALLPRRDDDDDRAPAS